MTDMKPVVSIIMGSTSDLPVMEKAAAFLDSIQVPFEMNALSAHRTPAAVEEFAKGAQARGIKVIIAAAGMAAALPGVIAANTNVPVIGVPIKGMLDDLDAMLSIIQMPPGIPVATVGVNGAQNAAILAAQILAVAGHGEIDVVQACLIVRISGIHSLHNVRAVFCALVVNAFLTGLQEQDRFRIGNEVKIQQAGQRFIICGGEANK
jgi:5-(carboxyamino)imidazole ribonucleotide mutase